MSESLPVVKKKLSLRIIVLVLGLMLVLVAAGYLIFSFRTHLRSLFLGEKDITVVEKDEMSDADSAEEIIPFAPIDEETLGYYNLPDFAGIPDPVQPGMWKAVSEEVSSIFVLGRVVSIDASLVTLEADSKEVVVQIDGETIQSTSDEPVQIYDLLTQLSNGDLVLVIGVLDDVKDLTHFKATSAYLIR
ncbi:MAG: hypothetical protein WC243_01480 [Patescibacteria group bacterium]|jgi:hypothetical protein